MVRTQASSLLENGAANSFSPRRSDSLNAPTVAASVMAYQMSARSPIGSGERRIITKAKAGG